MSREDIISQQVMRLGKLQAYGASALDWLVQQRRVFNRMDWWSPYEWLPSDVFNAIGDGKRVHAAALVIPSGLGQLNQLPSTNSRTAWVRWCAVADGTSASGALRPLLQYCTNELALEGVERIYAIVEGAHWLTTYLRESGFTIVDDVMTMVCRHPDKQKQALSTQGKFRIRPAIHEDIEWVHKVDQGAFEEQWQYPFFVLKRALETCAYYTVATHEEQIVGYQFATSDGQDAHITRLAVHPEFQRRGVGAVLLADALHYLHHGLGVRYVTLNTQASNRTSQRLYQRFGFQLILPSMQVLCSLGNA